ncbi:protein GPR107-like [Mya arenaria]|uniref:protein GPR107-like n=1 Tax=Mya arenaria TaxID=6604 RepID=UPI0022E8346E|nr:protein GPR107-like [Mya arenaria]
MDAKMKISRNSFLFMFNFCLITARIHHLELKNDDRDTYTLSTFGLLRGGVLSLNVSKFLFNKDLVDLEDGKLGFTIDVGSSSGASNYIEDLKEDECILDKKVLDDLSGGPREKKKNTTNILALRLKLKGDTPIIEIARYGDDIQRLYVNNIPIEEFRSKRQPPHQFQRRDLTSDSYLLGLNGNIARRRRAAAPLPTLPPPKVGQMDGNTTQAPADPTTVNPPGEKKDPFDLKYQLPVITHDKTIPSYNFSVMLAVLGDREEGIYTLNFHNCRSKSTKVNYVIDIIEMNGDNYLSAGMMPLPVLYFTLCGVYLAIAVLWNYIVCKAKDPVYKIHYLMLAVVYVKSLSCILHAMNYHFIQKEGIREEAWAVLFYIAYLTRGALLLITIILIGAGWAYIKHMLSDREKKLFLIVIPLQILDNIAWIIVEESEEGQAEYTTWKQIFILIDLLCCGAILFPVVWSISHLRDASHADGKAEFSLTKLKLFKQFYIMVVCYIYFTRIIVFLLKMTVPFKYEWLDEFFKELATITFFMVTGYKFKPATDNPYLQVPSDDEEDIEMDTVIVGQQGALDTVKRVNQAYNDETTSTGLKVRESSHEYD